MRHIITNKNQRIAGISGKTTRTRRSSIPPQVRTVKGNSYKKAQKTQKSKRLLCLLCLFAGVPFRVFQSTMQIVNCTSPGAGAAVIGRSTENFFAVGQGHTSTIDVVRTILRHESFDRNGIAGLERIFSPTLPAQTVRGTAFNSVARYLAGLVFHIDVIINVRIHPLHFRDCTCKLDRLAPVVLRSKRMVRQCRRYGAQNTEGNSHKTEYTASHCETSLDVDYLVELSDY